MERVLQTAVSDPLSYFYFNQTHLMKVFGVECRVTRCGYTGEDGVEVKLNLPNILSLIAGGLLHCDVKDCVTFSYPFSWDYI